MRLLFVLAFSAVVWLTAFFSVQAAVLKPMPPVVVLIICKAVITPGAPGSNDEMTGTEDIEWVIKDGLMICRRLEAPVMNQEDPEAEFTPDKCTRWGMFIAIRWDEQHKNTDWRVWRSACPVPIVRKNPDNTQDIIDWKIPECGHREIVKCESDTEI